MLFKNPNKCLEKIPNLSYDEACIDILNKLNATFRIYGQYDNCHHCRMQNITTLAPFGNTSVLIQTISPIELYYQNTDDNKDYCEYDI